MILFGYIIFDCTACKWTIILFQIVSFSVEGVGFTIQYVFRARYLSRLGTVLWRLQKERAVKKFYSVFGIDWKFGHRWYIREVDVHGTAAAAA